MVFSSYVSVASNLYQFISRIDYICNLIENKLTKCTERFSKCYDDTELKALRAGTVRSFFEMLRTLPIKHVGILFIFQASPGHGSDQPHFHLQSIIKYVCYGGRPRPQSFKEHVSPQPIMLVTACHVSPNSSCQSFPLMLVVSPHVSPNPFCSSQPPMLVPIPHISHNPSCQSQSQSFLFTTTPHVSHNPPWSKYQTYMNSVTNIL